MILVPLVSQSSQTQGVLSGTSSVSQGNVAGGYVDLTNNQIISGNKILLANLTISGNTLLGNPDTVLTGERLTVVGKGKFAFDNGATLIIREGATVNDIVIEGSTSQLNLIGGCTLIVGSNVYKHTGSSGGVDIGQSTRSYGNLYIRNLRSDTGQSLSLIPANGIITSNASKLVVSGIENIGMTGYAGGLQTYESSAGVLCVSGSIIPGGGGRTLGTTTFKWADVNAVLVNGADYVYENNWRTMELEKFPGYPLGIAIVSKETSPEKGKIQDVMEGKPTFAVAKDFIEFNGRRITMDQLDKLLDLLK